MKTSVGVTLNLLHACRLACQMSDGAFWVSSDGSSHSQRQSRHPSIFSQRQSRHPSKPTTTLFYDCSGLLVFGEPWRPWCFVGSSFPFRFFAYDGHRIQIKCLRFWPELRTSSLCQGRCLAKLELMWGMSCVRTIEPLQPNEQFWGLVLVSGRVLCKDFGRHAGIQRKVWQSLIEYYLEVSD